MGEFYREGAKSAKGKWHGRAGMSELTIPQAFDLALGHHQGGRLVEAEEIYRLILERQPDHADALHFLGVIAFQAGQNDVAVELIRRAIAVKPDYPEAYGNLGNVLRKMGRLDEAIEACRAAIGLRPEYAEGHGYLGVALKEKGCVEEAIGSFRQALAFRPDFPEGLNDLGNALRETAKFDEAAEAFRRTIELKPDFAEAFNNLGTVLRDKGRIDEATEAYRKAIALKPDYAEAHSNLGVALNDMDQLDEAIAEYRQAIALKEDFALAYSNLGNALKGNGELDAAIAAFREATARDPGSAVLGSNLLYMLNLHPDYDAIALAEEHRQWDAHHAEPLRRAGQAAHGNSPLPDRRLRIGYVSPEFFEHSAAFFLLPLLSNHDHGNFEIVCYSGVGRTDRVTQQIRGFADEWRDVRSLSDEELAKVIRTDRIDILVDLALHRIHGRLMTFARKPAPVQVTWLGYPGSTGLATMDYRLTDRYLDPPGLDDACYSEKSVRLPDAFWCYDPRVSDLTVGELPALAADHFTFGCLNNFCKVNAGVLKLWSAVLMKVRNSRLLLLAPRGRYRERVLSEMAARGVEPSRVEFLDRRSRREYLQLYRRIDLCLDTFPYNGHTTNLDGLWMGAPMVTLVGNTAVGRGGLSILSNVGLPELAARSEEEFVRIAGDLANDLPRLGRMRSTLRQRMEQSPLMDGPRFARNIEAAYREMWRTWCGIAENSPGR